ncbi:hypothetical protein BJ878DRAFT_232149 [Calycina marina]|uniref:rRNA-processing protein FYV7 n=1 Tax=Calycina marina TaxID=1763456 RepID=A0A9P8CBW1_9HELO|nr:hypothetical protein BJ878DRAFT_232149 [Calycina marina]
MVPKRLIEDDAVSSKPKKQRSTFNVGPDNLPDGTWRRKVIKIKHDMIHKAKVKKSYAKIKASEPIIDRPFPTEEEEASQSPVGTAEKSTQELHPDRQAMLEAPQTTPVALPSQESQFSQLQARKGERQKKRRGYFEKEQEFAKQKRAEAAKKRAEFEGRDQEKRQKIEDREKFRRAMAKARAGGKNGQRKLGKESKVLLEKVQRMVGN